MATDTVTVSNEHIAVGVKTAAKMTGVSERTCWRSIKAREVRTVRVGKRVLIAPEELRRWLGLDAEIEVKQ